MPRARFLLHGKHSHNARLRKWSGTCCLVSLKYVLRTSVLNFTPFSPVHSSPVALNIGISYFLSSRLSLCLSSGRTYWLEPGCTYWRMELWNGANSICRVQQPLPVIIPDENISWHHWWSFLLDYSWWSSSWITSMEDSNWSFWWWLNLDPSWGCQW